MSASWYRHASINVASNHQEPQNFSRYLSIFVSPNSFIRAFISELVKLFKLIKPLIEQGIIAFFSNHLRSGNLTPIFLKSCRFISFVSSLQTQAGFWSQLNQISLRFKQMCLRFQVSCWVVTGVFLRTECCKIISRWFSLQERWISYYGFY